MALRICSACGEETVGIRCTNCGEVTRSTPGSPPETSTVVARPATQAPALQRTDTIQGERLPPKWKPISARVRKQRYLARIREESAYPTFRTLNEIVAALLFLFGLLTIVMAVVIFRSDAQPISLAIGSVAGGLFIVAGIVQKEAASIGADIADSLLDANSREADA